METDLPDWYFTRGSTMEQSASSQSVGQFQVSQSLTSGRSSRRVVTKEAKDTGRDGGRTLGQSAARSIRSVSQSGQFFYPFWSVRSVSQSGQSFILSGQFGQFGQSGQFFIRPHARCVEGALFGQRTQ